MYVVAKEKAKCIVYNNFVSSQGTLKINNNKINFYLKFLS